MEINIPLRILLVVVLTILIYTFFKSDYRKRKINITKFIGTLFVAFIPPLFYFFAPDTISIKNKFYITLFLSVIVLVGLILSLATPIKIRQKKIKVDKY